MHNEAAVSIAFIQAVKQVLDTISSMIGQGETKQCLQVYAVACHSSAAQLHCQVAIPGGSIQLTPLYAKKVCQVPLSQSLQADLQQAAAKQPQNGLLSMDQARSLLPLIADDPNVSLCSLIMRIIAQQHKSHS